MSKHQAVLLKVFPCLQGCKDSLWRSWTLPKEDFNSGVPVATAKRRSNWESNSEWLHPMSREEPLSKYEMLIRRQTPKQRCLADKGGCWWTSSAEIICTCTWYQRHPSAAGPLIRKRKRGFHRWLDSNPPLRAVLLINLSFAMRLRSHRCVSSFIQREQPENNHGGYAFCEWQRLGWGGGMVRTASSAQPR